MIRATRRVAAGRSAGKSTRVHAGRMLAKRLWELARLPDAAAAVVARELAHQQAHIGNRNAHLDSHRRAALRRDAEGTAAALLDLDNLLIDDLQCNIS